MAFALDYAIVIIYFAAILLLGYFRGRGEHLLDFTVNNRSTSTLFLTTASLSTVFGVGSLLGVAAEAYRTGISYGMSVIFVTVLGFALMLWIGPKIKRFGDSHRAQTIADFFAQKYSIPASILTSALTITAALLSTSVQFIGIASLATVLTGVSWAIALGIAAAVTITYTSFGGLKNDIATDFIQFWLILSIFVILLPIGWIKTGGFASFNSLPSEALGFFTYGGPVFFFGSMFLGALAFMTQMDVWQRTYSARSELTVKKAYLYSFLISIPFYIMPIIFGLWARQLFPGIEGEQGLFTLMNNLLPTGLLGLGFAGILAAAMSSIDSLIVVGSTSFTNDIYARYIRKGAYEQHLLNRTRLFAIIFGVTALLIAYLVPNIVKLSILALFFTINLLPAIIGGFFWKKANSKAAFWSLALSTPVLILAWIFIGVNAWLPAILTSIFVFVIGSILTKNRASANL